MGAMAFWECVRQAWAEAARFIRRRPLTVAVAFTILLVCNAISMVGSGRYGAMSPGSASKFVQFTVMPVRLAVMMVLPVEVIRYVLLGERESHPRRMFGKEFWRYLGLSLLIGIGCMVIAALVVGVGFSLTHSFKAYFGGTGVQLAVWGTLAVCVISFFTTRLSLLFCHVAIGYTLRWRASWNDTRGHFWRIIVSHLLAAVPVELGVVGVLALIRASSGLAGKPTPPFFVASALALTTAVGMIVGATCACWLYRRFARMLLENPSSPGGGRSE